MPSVEYIREYHQVYSSYGGIIHNIDTELGFHRHYYDNPMEKAYFLTNYAKIEIRIINIDYYNSAADSIQFVVDRPILTCFTKDQIQEEKQSLIEGLFLTKDTYIDIDKRDAIIYYFYCFGYEEGIRFLISLSRPG